MWCAKAKGEFDLLAEGLMRLAPAIFFGLLAAAFAPALLVVTSVNADGSDALCFCASANSPSHSKQAYYIYVVTHTHTRERERERGGGRVLLSFSSLDWKLSHRLKSSIFISTFFLATEHSNRLNSRSEFAFTHRVSWLWDLSSWTSSSRRPWLH